MTIREMVAAALLVLFLVRLAMGYQFQSVASVSPYLVDEMGFIVSCLTLGSLAFKPFALVQRIVQL